MNRYEKLLQFFRSVKVGQILKVTLQAESIEPRIGKISSVSSDDPAGSFHLIADDLSSGNFSIAPDYVYCPQLARWLFEGRKAFRIDIFDAKVITVQNVSPNESVITFDNVCSWLKKTQEEVSFLVQSGKLPAISLCGHWLFDTGKIKAWLKMQNAVSI